jgi:hypothetical protein
MCPPISKFVSGILKEKSPFENNKTIDEICNDVLDYVQSSSQFGFSLPS